MWMGSVWDLLHFDCWPIDMSDSVGFCCLGMLVMCYFDLSGILQGCFRDYVNKFYGDLLHR